MWCAVGRPVLPSNARAAFTRWDQSNPPTGSGRGMSPASASLALSASEPSEYQRSSVETGRSGVKGRRSEVRGGADG